MVSSLATASHEPVASAVTETSRPTVDRRVSTRLQPESAMRRVTASRGDCGCVVYALISRWFSFGAGRGVVSLKMASEAVAKRGARRAPACRQHTCRRFRAASKIVGQVPTPTSRPRMRARRPARALILRLSGSITALATPFTAAGGIDFPAWERLLRAQLDAGTDAVVVAGSTGEAAALEDAEYDRLLECAVEFLADRMPVLAGTGFSATARTIRATRRAAELGADAALVVTPPYVRPTQAGLLAHYRAVADEGGLPVVLYNVPGRTGCDMVPETTGELSLHPNIVGIKEARAEESRMEALLPYRRDGFVVLSGDDPTAARAMLAGADGVIS